MRVYSACTLSLPGSVVTIGAFDGVHLGHQALVRYAVSRAATFGVPSVAYTFDPPPRVYFQDAPLLAPIHEKVYRLSRLGLDHTVVARFDADYASRSVEDFLEELADLNPQEVWVGADFRFGREQAGDVHTLGKRFATRVFEPVRCEDGRVISSTRIRALKVHDALGEADCLLGWNPWEWSLRTPQRRPDAVPDLQGLGSPQTPANAVV